MIRPGSTDIWRMDEPEKSEIFEPAHLTTEMHPFREAGSDESTCLEDSGNCRQDISQDLNPHVVNDSLLTEQQKLRLVLHWAESFLNSGLDVHNNISLSNSLILSDEEQRQNMMPKHSPAAQHHLPFSSTSVSGEVFGKVGIMGNICCPETLNYNSCQVQNRPCAYKLLPPDEPHIPLTFTQRTDEVTRPEDRQSPRSVELMDTTFKQTPNPDNYCMTWDPYISNQRDCSTMTDRDTNQRLASDGATYLIKESISSCNNPSCKSNAMSGPLSDIFSWMPGYGPLFKSSEPTDVTNKTVGPQAERGASWVNTDTVGLLGHQKELGEAKEEATWGKKEDEEVEGERKAIDRMAEREGKEEDNKCNSCFEMCSKKNISKSGTEDVSKHITKTADLNFGCHLKIQADLTIYEQYLLCMKHLDHLRVGQSQHVKPGDIIQSHVKERNTSEETYTPADKPDSPTSCFEVNPPTAAPKITKHLKNGLSKITAADFRKTSNKERPSDVVNIKQDKTTYINTGATLAQHGKTRSCDVLKTTVEEVPVPSGAVSRPVRQRKSTHNVISTMKLDPQSTESTDKSVGNIKSPVQVVDKPADHYSTSPDDGIISPVEENAALTAHPVVVPKKSKSSPGVKGLHDGVKGHRKRTGSRVPSWRFWEKSSLSWSSLNHGEVLPRSWSAGMTKHTSTSNTHRRTKRQTPEERMRLTSPDQCVHTPLSSKETHTPHHDFSCSGPTSHPSPDTAVHVSVDNDIDYKFRPAGVSVFNCWLRLPDEVWLSILSLLPHSFLSTAAQVCHHLHRLATDQSLWKNIRIENCSSLTDQWLLCVGGRCPRKLSLYRCTGPSITYGGLEKFFSLSRSSLEELKVTSCSGLGLHGDVLLRLIGQLCDRVTSVDVSWSGATDRGVKALTDGCTRLKLETVVLNGCQVTDDPLIKLIMRHKESLCRLEVFGCLFLTPSCLETVYELCPRLRHLNIGQVPKVNAHSLTVMTSHLKCLLSLNLTGLQALSDATVEKVLQNCVSLHSLTLRSCQGVTDLTLHNISTHTPCIRSLDVSGCKAVTDAGVQSVALGCRRIQQLDLSSTGAGNRGVILLAHYCSPHLHTVKLSFCHISPESILKLCRHCKRLKVLHLYGCAHVPSEKQIREVNASVKVNPLP